MPRLELKAPPGRHHGHCHVAAGSSLAGNRRRLVDAWLVWMAASVGLLLLASNLFMFLQARTTIDPLRPQHSAQLVTGGVNQISRNPIYLDMLFWLLAWAIWLGNLLALIGLPVFVLYMNRFQVEPEERFLSAKAQLIWKKTSLLPSRSRK